MSISRGVSGSAQTTSATLSGTATAADELVVFAHRDGSNTVPANITGCTTLESGGSNTNSDRVLAKTCAGTETSTGTSSTATSIGGVAYHGCDPQVPFGDVKQGGGSSATLAFPALSMQVTDGTSWVVACGASRTATNVNANAPSLTLVTGVADFGISDSNGGVSSYAGGNQTVNVSNGWRTAVVELVAKQSTALPSEFVQAVQTASNQNTETGQDFLVPLPNTTGSNNALLAFITYEAGTSRACTVSGIGGTVTATKRAGTLASGNALLSHEGWVIEGIASGVTALKFHFADAGSATPVNGFQCCMLELSGIATSSAFDAASAANSGGASGVATQTIQPGSLTTTATNDIVVVYAISNDFGANLQGASVTGWRAQPGMRLIHADRNIGIALAIGKRASTGAFNPTIYAADTVNDDFACLAIALKTSAGAGTPGTGMRVVNIAHTQVPQATSAQVSAPVNGNLQVLLGAHGGGLVAITSATGSGAGSYTLNAPAGNNPQCAYAANLSDDGTNVITFAMGSSAGWPFLIYDIAGADASPFDLRATASGGATGAGNISTAPTITPSAAGGVVLAAIRLTGPPDSMSAPTGVVFDSVYYTGETDGSTMDIGEGYGHLTNAAASAQSFTWHNTVSTPDWDASAFAFKAPAAGSVGSTTSASSVAGAGASLAASSGAASATCTTSGAGRSLAAAVCAIACSSAVAATGAALGAGVGGGAAASAVAGVGAMLGVGSAACVEVSAVAGAGANLAAATCTAAVTSSATGVGAALAASVGTVASACTTAGTGIATATTVGTVTCSSSVAGVGGALDATSGAILVASSAAGSGASLAATSGTITSACTVAGISPGGATGACTEASSCSATGAAPATCSGSSTSSSAVVAVGVSVGAGAGAIGETSAAAGTGGALAASSSALSGASAVTGLGGALAATTGTVAVTSSAAATSNASGSNGAISCTSSASGTGKSPAATSGNVQTACTVAAGGATRAAAAGASSSSAAIGAAGVGATLSAGNVSTSSSCGGVSTLLFAGTGACATDCDAEAIAAIVARITGSVAAASVVVGVGSTQLPPTTPTVGAWTKGAVPTVGAWTKVAPPTVGAWTKNESNELATAA